jgi:hypothetical protein
MVFFLSISVGIYLILALLEEHVSGGHYAVGLNDNKEQKEV